MQNQAILQRYTELLQAKGYSRRTVTAYTRCFEDFLRFFAGRDIDRLEQEAIVSFLASKQDEEISSSYQNIYVSAVKSYFEQVTPRKAIKLDIPRHKKDNKLPEVLSGNEVAHIFAQVSNLKHRAILYVIYSGGLRISEAVNLQLCAISDQDCFFSPSMARML